MADSASHADHDPRWRACATRTAAASATPAASDGCDDAPPRPRDLPAHAVPRHHARRLAAPTRLRSTAAREPALGRRLTARDDRHRCAACARHVLVASLVDHSLRRASDAEAHRAVQPVRRPRATSRARRDAACRRRHGRDFSLTRRRATARRLASAGRGVRHVARRLQPAAGDRPDDPRPGRPARRERPVGPDRRRDLGAGAGCPTAGRPPPIARRCHRARRRSRLGGRPAPGAGAPVAPPATDGVAPAAASARPVPVASSRTRSRRRRVAGRRVPDARPTAGRPSARRARQERRPARAPAGRRRVGRHRASGCGRWVAGVPPLVLLSGSLLIVGLGLFVLRWGARRFGD